MEQFQKEKGIPERKWEKHTRVIGRTGGEVDPRLGLLEDQFPVRVVHKDIFALVLGGGG